MRFLHVADIHLGSKTHSRPDPKTGLPSSYLSVAKCWKHATEIAVERKVDLVIVAGDTFHTPNPDAAALNLFREGMQAVMDAGIPVVIIAGNHDRAPHAGRQSVIEVFGLPGYVYPVTRPGVVDVDGIRIACLPSVSRHHLMATNPGISRLQAEEALVEGLQRILEKLRAEDADVLTGHWPVQGAILGNEKDISIIPEPMLPMAELAGPWGYAAFGHIHRSQLEVRQGWAYAGSIDRMNFGEPEEKVAIEVECVPASLGSLTRHKLPARDFLTFDWGDYEWQQVDPAGAIVRMRGVPEEEVDRLQRGFYKAGTHIAYVERAPREEPIRRAETVTEALQPMEALEEVMRLREVPEDDRPAIRTLAEKLLQEAHA